MSKETTKPISVTVEALVKAPVEKVWKTWNTPEDITKWCQASDDWHAPYAENDLRKGGKFKTTMAAKDGSFSFDFGGEYTNVEINKVIEYIMEDGRKTKIVFTAQGNETKVVETFDAESENPVEFQQQGWQAILNNFKKYTESIS
ncbi:activator of Hsp90 ATPase 1 family protein [Sporocytophaga myxococcoides]|uniref:Activator of Hsp90 ATPase 1 family protein n=1 Tax=Sporocytophaga myxococcoides TaxID=153721 RepID=A0A098LGS8_9BACT|nr:SRPBCC family protein [Sporocytophaga myxococcoides]GAL85672.1 activator of Hsp90 ATPase 1 family protein [Sporocytophaga myxococcoides]